jgi:hypothetical protein
MLCLLFPEAMKATFRLQQGQDQLAAGMVLFLLGLVTCSRENRFTVWTYRLSPLVCFTARQRLLLFAFK